MSLIQSIIGSAAGLGGPAWQFPPFGNLYPVASNVINQSDSLSISGYYEAGSLTSPQLGLTRYCWAGNVITDMNTVDTRHLPSFYTLEPSGTGLDAAVGFGNDSDVATNFSMEWLGYYKPSQTGDYIFQIAIDDYAMFWLGQAAVSGFDANNTIVKADNATGISPKIALIADKYYPVRIRYTEVQGGHNCTIWSGLNNSAPVHNLQSSTGQFFSDTNTSSVAFPGSGLIV